MDQAHQDFYQALREKIASRTGKRAGDLVLLAPDFFYLLAKLIADPRVPLAQRARLGMAIAYFISPFDFIPEAILGPAGLMDDLALASLVLNNLFGHVDEGVIQEHWKGRGSSLRTIRRVAQASSRWLPAGRFRKLWQWASRRG
jgi:uncharacterized membrane protein YkvA (DUF1232 family)